MYVEKFGGAAIDADPFPFIEFSFAVVFGNAFLQASLGESNTHVNDSRVMSEF